MSSPIIFPHALKKGDKIAIVSPAGSVEVPQLDQTLALIQKKGYIPILGSKVYEKYHNGYSYAGTEEERIKELNWALNHPDVSAIWTSRGGYGCQHLVQHLDLKGFKKQPKWLIGYSDVTVLQSFLFKKGYASIHGQSIKTGSSGVSENAYENIFKILSGKSLSYEIASNPFNRKGKAKGKLVGGNLALIYALMGTPYAVKFQDNILFIEEVGENFYALDRMLMSLELAGVFKKIKALVVGGMTNMSKENDNPQYESSFDEFANALIAKRVSKYDFPVVFDFPNGHIFDNNPLIIGADVELSVASKVSLKF